MNTRRLTKKYKHKSRSKKNRKNRKTRRRVLKGGAPGVRPSRGRLRPIRGVVVSSSVGVGVRRTSDSVGVRPSSSAGVFKVSCCDNVHLHNRRKIIDSINNFHLKDFYENLYNTDLNELSSTIESVKEMYITRTTLQPSGAYLNMNGLKLINYLRNKYKYTTDEETKEKIRTIISLFDQYGMSHGIRLSDLPIVQGQVSKKYFACYKKLYKEIYDKLFPGGNDDYYPVSLSAIPLYCKNHLPTIAEGGDE